MYGAGSEGQVVRSNVYGDEVDTYGGGDDDNVNMYHTKGESNMIMVTFMVVNVTHMLVNET